MVEKEKKLNKWEQIGYGVAIFLLVAGITTGTYVFFAWNLCPVR